AQPEVGVLAEYLCHSALLPARERRRGGDGVAPENGAPPFEVAAQRRGSQARDLGRRSTARSEPPEGEERRGLGERERVAELGRRPPRPAGRSGPRIGGDGVGMRRRRERAGERERRDAGGDARGGAGGDARGEAGGDARGDGAEPPARAGTAWAGSPG